MRGGSAADSKCLRLTPLSRVSLLSYFPLSLVVFNPVMRHSLSLFYFFFFPSSLSLMVLSPMLSLSLFSVSLALSPALSSLLSFLLSLSPPPSPAHSVSSLFISHSSRYLFASLSPSLYPQGAMSAAEISKQFNLTSLKNHSWHIQACCALTGEGLYEGMEWLTGQISKR